MNTNKVPLLCIELCYVDYSSVITSDLFYIPDTKSFVIWDNRTITSIRKDTIW